MDRPKAPKGTREVKRGNTTFDVDDHGVIVSRVVEDDRGNVVRQTRDAARDARGEE
jgi:hypothetical protein